jgi:hypothetical protein
MQKQCLIKLERQGKDFGSIENFMYYITCSKKKFDVLRTDDRFLGLLTLARVVNALRFCQKAAIDAKDTPGPAGARSRINSALYASSVLYEGFLVIEKLGRYFRDLNSFKTGFGALLRDKAVGTFRESVLKRMRNKFVFHFDQGVARESFNHFELPEYNFASGTGRTSGEMYFGLADEAVMNYLLQPAENESDESLKGRCEKTLQNITQIMGRFTESAERLMADVLDGMGFSIRTNQ